MTTQEWIDKESKVFDDLNNNYLNAKNSFEGNQNIWDASANIASGIGGAVGSVGGAAFGGPLGVMLGGSLGAALGPMVSGIGSLVNRGKKEDMDRAFNTAQKQLLETEKANMAGREVNQIRSYAPGSYGDSFVQTRDKTMLT